MGVSQAAPQQQHGREVGHSLHFFLEKSVINIPTKMLSTRLARFSGFSRKLMTSAIRKSDDPGGIPGANVPFQIKNRFRLTVVFTVFFGSGLAVPFLLVRHQLLKK